MFKWIKNLFKSKAFCEHCNKKGIPFVEFIYTENGKIISSCAVCGANRDNPWPSKKGE